jgi:hypothetical protein
MYENRVLSKVFLLKLEAVTEAGENCTVKSFMIGIPHQALLYIG